MGQQPRKRRGRSASVSHNSSFLSLYNLLLHETGLSHQLVPFEIDSNYANANSQLLKDMLHFVNVPIHLEKFMLFGLLCCLHDFLVVFTVLPLKLAVCVVQSAKIVYNKSLGSFKSHLMVFYVPLVQALLLAASLHALSDLDTSKLYHDIRRQSAVKLYVMIGVLDVVDKLVSTMGEIILKFLFNLQFLSSNKPSYTSFITFVIAFSLALVYLLVHSVCLIYQTVSLNVAVNSYSNALFTLLLSSQFSEIKSTVFKKFDREGLFQNSCSDLVERFQLIIYLFLIGLRNLVQVHLNDHDGLIPSFWTKNLSIWSLFSPSTSWFNVSGFKSIQIFLNPTIAVIGSELLVDWLKHSYITNYNHFNPKIYDRFLNLLANDFLELHYYPYASSTIEEKPHNTPQLSIQDLNYRAINSIRNLNIRIGVPMLALNLLVFKMAWPSVNQFLFDNFPAPTSVGEYIKRFLNLLVMVVLLYFILLTVKLILSLCLLKWSTRRKTTFIKTWKKFDTSVSHMESVSERHYARRERTGTKTGLSALGITNNEPNRTLVPGMINPFESKSGMVTPQDSEVEEVEPLIDYNEMVNDTTIGISKNDSLNRVATSSGTVTIDNSTLRHRAEQTPKYRSSSQSRTGTPQSPTKWDSPIRENMIRFEKHIKQDNSIRQGSPIKRNNPTTRGSPIKKDFPDRTFISNLYEYVDVVNNDYDLRNGTNSLILGAGTLTKNDLKFLYDDFETRSSVDEYRLKNDLKKIVKKNHGGAEEISNEGGLDNVVRYKMSSKRIY